MGSNSVNTPWTEKRIDELRDLWTRGLSTAEIGRRLGLSSNAVVGKAHRLDLPGRPSPIKRADPATRAPTPSPKPVPKLAEIMPLAARAKATPPPVNARRPGPVSPGPAARERSAPRPPPEPCKPLKVRTTSCRWPIGEPGTKAFRFCDDAALPGKPYCAEHAKRAYAPNLPVQGRAQVVT